MRGCSPPAAWAEAYRLPLHAGARLAAMSPSGGAAADVDVARACAAADPAAIAALEGRYFAAVRVGLTRLGVADSAQNGVLEALRAELLGGGEGRAPRILEYSGRGSLAGWLRVVASRLALRLARPDRLGSSLSATMHMHDAGDLELEIVKQKYGAAFRDAFRRALASLHVQDRLVVKQRFALQLTVVELASLYGLDAPSMSERVSAARARLVEATRVAMLAELRVADPDASRMRRLIDAQLDVSLDGSGGPAAP